jgi:transcriptional regulator GlxA family with amidase domain
MPLERRTPVRRSNSLLNPVRCSRGSIRCFSLAPPARAHHRFRQEEVMNRIALVALLSLALSASAESYTKNVAIVLYNGVEVLDFAGPAEVFAAAASFGSNGGERAFNVYTVSKTKAPIVSQGFIDVTPDYSIVDSPKPDVIVLPGGGTDSVLKDSEWMAWVRASAGDADTVLTVCTGAFIAGRLGLLDGNDATTWYAAVPRLTKEFPNARVMPGRRFVDNGKVITTAGVSAGIDGALHYVARTLGRYVADRTAEYMEYAWSPQAYTSSKYPQLNPRLDASGRKRQEAAIAARGGDNETAASLLRELVARDPADTASWMSLGQILHDQKQYGQAISAFRNAATNAKQRAGALYNLACAYALSGEKEKALDAISGAIEAGFRHKSMYEDDEDFASIRDDVRFKQLIAGL